MTYPLSRQLPTRDPEAPTFVVGRSGKWECIPRRGKGHRQDCRPDWLGPIALPSALGRERLSRRAGLPEGAHRVARCCPSIEGRRPCLPGYCMGARWARRPPAGDSGGGSGSRFGALVRSGRAALRSAVTSVPTRRRSSRRCNRRASARSRSARSNRRSGSRTRAITDTTRWSSWRRLDRAATSRSLASASWWSFDLFVSYEAKYPKATWGECAVVIAAGGDRAANGADLGRTDTTDRHELPVAQQEPLRALEPGQPL